LLANIVRWLVSVVASVSKYALMKRSPWRIIWHTSTQKNAGFAGNVFPNVPQIQSMKSISHRKKQRGKKREIIGIMRKCLPGNPLRKQITTAIK
jgi:hypothetical protein